MELQPSSSQQDPPLCALGGPCICALCDSCLCNTHNVWPRCIWGTGLPPWVNIALQCDLIARHFVSRSYSSSSLYDNIRPICLSVPNSSPPSKPPLSSSSSFRLLTFSLNPYPSSLALFGVFILLQLVTSSVSSSHPGIEKTHG